MRSRILQETEGELECERDIERDIRNEGEGGKYYTNTCTFHMPHSPISIVVVYGHNRYISIYDGHERYTPCVMCKVGLAYISFVSSLL